MLHIIKVSLVDQSSQVRNTRYLKTDPNWWFTEINKCIDQVLNHDGSSGYWSHSHLLSIVHCSRTHSITN